MNRLEMQAIIKDRVPFLIEQYQQDWKEYEKLRQTFVKDYSIERIGNLPLKTGGRFFVFQFPIAVSKINFYRDDFYTRGKKKKNK